MVRTLLDRSIARRRRDWDTMKEQRRDWRDTYGAATAGMNYIECSRSCTRAERAVGCLLAVQRRRVGMDATGVLLPPPTSVLPMLGAVIVVASGLYILWRETVRRKRPPASATLIVARAPEKPR